MINTYFPAYHRVNIDFYGYSFYIDIVIHLKSFGIFALGYINRVR